MFRYVVDIFTVHHDEVDQAVHMVTTLQNLTEKVEEPREKNFEATFMILSIETMTVYLKLF